MEGTGFVPFSGSLIPLSLKLCRNPLHARSVMFCKHGIEGKNSGSPRKLDWRPLYQKGNRAVTLSLQAVWPPELHLQTIQLGA